MAGDEVMELDAVPVPGETGEYEPVGPRPIRKLSKDVINQIAAAEIIHRPSNAIKELLENSLDAGSTSIRITLKDGGLKLLQVQDNGHGISRDDLPLLCTRYATSKLEKFSDLQRLGTYGFRGEALASISYCSHVEVVTKRRGDGAGWRAHYLDGELVSPKPGASADPRPAAANDGTIISAEDLFYNMPLRKRAFKSPSDEYNRVLDVVQKYAVHNPQAAWVCKKSGSSLPDISTPVASTAKANIGLLYTPSLAADLLEVPETVLQPADKLAASVRGWVSSANTNWTRRGGWLFFINNRLVDSSKIKKAIDSLYMAYLPKGASPWIYLSLTIDPSKVDVNVSPTKADVHFLNEDEMVEAICTAVQTALVGANTSRSFKVQTLLPGARDPFEKRGESSSSVQQLKKPAPNYKVRTDLSSRTLDSMFAVNHPSQVGEYAPDDEGGRASKRRAVGEEAEGSEMADLVAEDELDEEAEDGFRDDEESTPLWSSTAGAGGGKKGKGREIPESECDFSSIQELRRAVRKKGNTEMTEIMQKHAFVGIVDEDMCLSLIQHSTRLFLVNHAVLGDEHFYQLGLRQFGAFDKLQLDPPPPLRELLKLAAEDEPGLLEAGLHVDEVVEEIATLLLDKREMIDEYFSICLSERGEVESLPMILRGYTPDLDRLPHFLLCLGTQVDWEDEKMCFHTILTELAFFYSPRPFSSSSSDHGAAEDETAEKERQHRLWQLEHVLFPSFRKYTAWPKGLQGKDVRQVANLPDLFRIFERC